MLYYLAQFINEKFNPPGFDVFRFITWRSAIAAITAMFISFIIGPKIIKYIKKKGIGEEIRVDGPQVHMQKKGTPTMGGVIVIFSIVLPVLLWADVLNTYTYINNMDGYCRIY
jgi:phospho-N-acetylmuramoyl-pentapeptide-transferase